jgi:hypothetical protein
MLVSNSQYVLMDTIRCKTTLCGGHDRLTELVGVGCHVSCCIESLHTCLLALVDDEATLRILVSLESIDNLGEWR